MLPIYWYTRPHLIRPEVKGLLPSLPGTPVLQGGGAGAVRHFRDNLTGHFKMMLFRYFKNHVLDTVRDSRLKVSKLADFNDPFEGMFYLPETITAKEARQAALKMQKTLFSSSENTA
jgi:hypothetical protein